jgi:DNA helicase-2/ATP-dependent DNA helicase PcrA
MIKEFGVKPPSLRETPMRIGEEDAQSKGAQVEEKPSPINVEIYPPAVRDYLAALNGQQILVAAASSGPYVVAGGPGGGKTRAIVARMARMVCDGLDPNLILAMTFTKAAAGEMTARLQSLGITGARVGTIHSVCLEIMKTECANLTNCNEVDRRSRLSYALRKGIGDMLRKKRVGRAGVDRQGIERFISSCKAGGICYVDGDPFRVNFNASDHLMEQAKKWQHEAGVPPGALFEFYHDFERTRGVLQLYSFDDMLLWAWMALVSDLDALERWRCRWSAVIVDEAQDSNPIQWDLARLLVGYPSCLPSAQGLPNPPAAADRDRTLMVAGDSSQSIYGWRDAEPDQFVGFADEEETTLLTLPAN